jgi:hypothetical protein
MYQPTTNPSPKSKKQAKTQRKKISTKISELFSYLTLKKQVYYHRTRNLSKKQGKRIKKRR